MPEDEGSPHKIPKPLQGSVPAYVGAVGMAVYVILQAMGVDLAAITGKGQAHQVATLEKRMDAADIRHTASNARIRTVEGNVGILFERTDNAKEDRAEIKRTLTDINRSMGSMNSSLARIEAKLDRTP